MGTQEESRQSWRCVFYGDLYELAEGEQTSIEEDVLTEQHQQRPVGVKAPKGYHYRCLNTNGTEVVLDVFDIAGRCYPDLFETDSSYFYSPDDKERKGRVQAGDAVMTLVGLRPAPSPQSSVTVWKGKSRNEEWHR